MQKLKILLKAYPKHPKEYGIFREENWERLAWEKMTEQIKAPLRYLKHFIESEWVDTSSVDGFYKFRSRDCPLVDIPYGTLSYYAIVYVEDMESGAP